MVHIAGDVPESATTTELRVNGDLIETKAADRGTFTYYWDSPTTPGAYTIEVSARGGSESWVSSVSVLVRGQFNIEQFGASVDSPDNMSAIQQALDAARPGGGTVVIPSGTYIVRPGAARSLHVYSNTEVRGEGPESILKIPDNNEDFEALFEDFVGNLSNRSFDNFTIDLNPTKLETAPPRVVSLATGAQSGFIFIGTSHNLVFDRVSVIQSGLWAIRINGDGLTVNECETYFDPGYWGSDAPDYSSIYPTGSHVLVRGNQATTSDPLFNGTGIEVGAGGTDEDNAVIENNIIYGTSNGMIIENVPNERESHFNIHHNQFLNNQYGLEFWSISYGFRGLVRYVRIANNTFISSGMFFCDSECDASVSGDYQDVRIENNTVDFSLPNSGAVAIAASPRSQMINGLTIADNVIVAPSDVYSAGILLGYGADTILANISVVRNTIVDAGMAIVIRESAFYSPVNIDDNVIEDRGILHPRGIFAVWGHPRVATPSRITLYNTQRDPRLLYEIDTSMIDDGS